MGTPLGWIAGIGLAANATSKVVQGIGQSKANQSEAEQSIMAWRVGQAQADQIDAAYRDELDSTMRNIRAIQASAGAPTDSASAQAVAAREAEASDRDRRVAVASARLQANQSGLDAFAFRRAARWSLWGGILGGLGTAAQAAGLRTTD